MTPPNPIYLSAAQVIRLHDYQIGAYGGVPGLRDEGLLLSALAQPGLEVFGEEMHPTLAAKAAAYLFHLIKNHPFHDANKRTSLHTTLVFVFLNGHSIRASDDELFALVLGCATGQFSKAELTETLSKPSGAAMTSTQLAHVRLHGLGLTDDFLLQLSDRAQTAKVDGATPASYDLPPKTSLEEAIQDAWDDARKAWLKYQTHQTDAWAGWVRPLLRALDYSFAGGGASGGKYTVNHLSETGDVPLHFTRQPDLDRVTDEAGLRVSPHGLMQGYLNATPAHLWGLVTNGETLRLLRDNAQVTRPAYAEFALGEMLRTEDARAFRVLWLLLHRTRLRGAKASVLEGWNEASKALGQRANDTLRDGVQRAIEHLGSGFLHRNPALLERTRTGEVSATDLYRACLNTVYQMVFLFVTEDRDLLFARNEAGEYLADAQTRARAAHYLTRALRQKATALRGNPTHHDAYAGWERLLGYLRTGFEPLGLPALGSFLFQPNLLSELKLSNEAFYEAVGALSEISVNGAWRPVNYAGLDSEELGSIYESLLELVPRIEPGPRFSLTVLPGNERKSTGSYYTPSSLIALLLDSALEPVIEDAVRGKLLEDAIAALKKLKVIDPACGSGHFLIAAARRIALRLAELEEETSQPSPRALRRATRTVIAHCIYGADINPMAIELAKVALWLESQDAGKPLAFLDHRLRVGNSLLGTTPELMNAEDEIPGKTVRGVTSKAVKARTLHLPDDAFSVIEGDDKKTVSELKRRNKAEREQLIKTAYGAQTLFNANDDLAPISAFYRALDRIEPEGLEQVRAQESTFQAIRENQALRHQQLLADAWCAAFVAPKVPDLSAITTATLNLLKQNPDAPALADVRATAQAMAKQYRFLHPHIEFPDVFTPEQGGFDCVLGNPPWDMVELDDAEFFAATDIAIATETDSDSRKAMIAALQVSNPILYDAYLREARNLTSFRHFIQVSGRYPLSSIGRINLFPVFQEVSQKILSQHGHLGMIMPTSIATSVYNSTLFETLVNHNRIKTFIDFINTRSLFTDVDSRFRFCILITSNNTIEFPLYAFMQESVDSAQNNLTEISKSDLSVISPITFAPPIIRSRKDFTILMDTISRVPLFMSKLDWNPDVKRMHSLSDGKGLFTKTPRSEEWMPLYAGKTIHQYTSTHSTFISGKWEDLSRDELANKDRHIKTAYFVRKDHHESRKTSKNSFIIGYRDITNSTNERTAIAAIIPNVACDTTLRNIYSSEKNIHFIVSNMNSYIFDYLTRLKVADTHLNATTLLQIPMIRPKDYAGYLVSFITPRVLELTYTAYDLTGFARDLGYGGEPFTWNDERRFWLRAELDALYFILYGIERGDVDYIMETFPIVKRKDVAAHGSYRTKEAILSVYDELQQLGLERLGEYRSRVVALPDGDVAGGWLPR